MSGVLVVKPSSVAYDAATQLLTEAIERRGLTLFARIDHAAGAQAAGLELEPEAVVVFGNARSGTPLMQEDPHVGIELPLRILVWQQGERVQLGYHDPRELGRSYDVSAHASTLEAMASLLDELTDEAAA